MLRTLSADHVQAKISILRDGQDFTVTFHPGKDAEIIYNNGKQFCSGCMNCVSPKCINIGEDDIKCAEFANISHDTNRFICPVDAIKSGAERVEIDDDKCIGCGLCAASCPIGAIYLKDGKAKVSVGDKTCFEELSVNAEGIKRQKDFISKIATADKDGILQQETDHIMESVYKKIRKMSQEEQNILTRNLLIRLGNHATLARQGNVYMRMDGFYSNSTQSGVVEIEAGADMLDVSRAILDDVAVLNVRYGVEKNKNHPLAILLSLPNKRTDYWQILKDIKDVVEMSIATVTFGALFIFLWNNKVVYDFNKFYIDVDNSSIRRVVSDMIGRDVEISEGLCGILENAK